MIALPRRMEWSGLSLSIVVVLAMGSIAVASFVAGRAPLQADRAFEALPVVEERSLSGRLAAVDEALARNDAGRAIYEWRDAYGLALRSRRWDAMAAVGDAALKIDAATGAPTGHPTGFRAEARQAYLKALFDARAAASPEGMERIAASFAALGDTHMAAQARALAKR
jgi:hypothetical protein